MSVYKPIAVPKVRKVNRRINKTSQKARKKIYQQKPDKKETFDSKKIKIINNKPINVSSRLRVPSNTKNNTPFSAKYRRTKRK